MPSPNKSYSVQAEKQENIEGVGAVSDFPGAALLSIWFTATKVPGRSKGFWYFAAHENGTIRARLCVLSFCGGTGPRVVDRYAGGSFVLTFTELLLTS